MSSQDSTELPVPGDHVPYPSEPGEPLYCRACTEHFDAAVRWECRHALADRARTDDGDTVQAPN